MKPSEAIEWLKGCVVSYEVDNKGRPNGNVTCDLTQEVLDMAISALEKQEQTNAQSVNSMRTSRPNALESLNILEQAKDDKGNVPMSLVRQAFRNVMEQDTWISCKERLPENKKKVLVSYDTEDGKKVDVSMFDKYGCLLGLVSAWRPLPEPYTEEEV